MGLQTWHEAGGGDAVLHCFAEAVVWTMYDGEEDADDAEDLACALWRAIESGPSLTPAEVVDALSLPHFLALAHCVNRYMLCGDDVGDVFTSCNNILAEVRARKGWAACAYVCPDFKAALAAFVA